MNERLALSVVVADVNGVRTLAPWLAAIRPQLTSDVEVLLVRPADAPAIIDVPYVRTLSAASDALVPSMWSTGLQQARGSVVAVTITACIPAPDWIEAILAAHQAPYAAIGGVIDHTLDADLVDRALHLVRYTPYLPPLPAGPVAEVAGDNGTYKRAAIEPFMTAIAAEGFWEAEINRQLRARGESLWIDPTIRVAHAASYSASSFSRQRFAHGRVFGRTRRASLAPGQRFAHAARAPIVPFVMLARHVRTVYARGRLDPPTLVAVPLALWFLTCWAAGEAVGILDG